MDKTVEIGTVSGSFPNGLFKRVERQVGLE
jgi:hypothetical protein